MNEIVLVAREWKARALLRAQLSEEGYEVVALRTIEEAMMLLSHGMLRPSLIILDTMGQSLNESVLTDLQALADHAPILVCAGPFDLARFDFEGAGFANVLVRPFTVGDVVNAVRNVLGDEAMGNEATRQ